MTESIYEKSCSGAACIQYKHSLIMPLEGADLEEIDQ